MESNKEMSKNHLIEGERKRNRTKHDLDLNCLCRGHGFLHIQYMERKNNNQHTASKAPYLFHHPICSGGELVLNVIHLISPWISRHDWAVLCKRRHQGGLMGLEIYVGTIWAALAFKLQSSAEMGNDNGMKIKENLQLTITVRAGR